MVALFAVTFGLSWRARRAQERWHRLVGVETAAVAQLEELVRAQNGFHRRLSGGLETRHRYRLVEQLLNDEALSAIPLGTLRGRVKAFRTIIAEEQPRRTDVDSTSAAVVEEARSIIDARKAEIARQLPSLEHEAQATMSAALAVSWIVAILGFAAVQTTLRKVVKPLEELADAADRIADGDLTARAPVGGDREIAALGISFNRMADELKSRARTDDLTRLPNFRAFRERIDADLDRADRYPESFGVLILDLDRFKQYNDTYGHQAGNDTLRRVSGAIGETVRAVDFAARYGGEEFAVVLPQVDGPALMAIAERIRVAVEALPAPRDGAAVTISIGAALFPADGSSRETLIRAADERLYEAKRLGRNRVVGPGAKPAAPAGRSAARELA